MKHAIGAFPFHVCVFNGHVIRGAMWLVLGIVSGLCASLIALDAHAQSNSDILRVIDKIAEDERRYKAAEQERERARRLQNIVRSPRQEKPLELLPEIKGKCINISSIEIEGVTLIPAADIAKVKQQYANTCMGKAELNNILRRLTNLYISRGYITSRAYIPPQNLSTGVFKVVVIEGRIAAVRDAAGKKRNFANIFTGKPNRPLNMRDIEQGLDQLRRMRSVKAKSSIEPGKDPGTSTVVIEQKRGRAIGLDFSVDNSGSRNTGKYINSVGITVDDLIGLNGVAQARVRFNPNIQPKRKMNFDFSSSYDVPYGYWNFIVSGGISATTSIINGDVSDFQSKTRKWNAQVSVKRMLYRDEKSKLSALLSLNGKGTKTLINNNEVGISTYDRYFTTLSVDYSRVLSGGGVFSASLGGNLGLRTIIDYRSGGRRMPLPDGFPDQRYLKFTGSVDWIFPVSIGGSGATLNLSAKGQYSSDKLFGDELFQIGGSGSVRGYEDYSLSDKSGVNFRSKLTMGDLANVLPFAITPYVGFDAGIVFDSQETTRNNTLTSLSTGFSAMLPGKISMQVDYGIAMTYPGRFERRDQSFQVRIAKLF